MSWCRTCAIEVPPQSRFCLSCGAPMDPSGIETAIDRPGAASWMSRTADGGRHGELPAPGSTLEGRYRIIGRLGRGGMGEVFRADDLRLGQQVALKFLPPIFASDPRRIVRFHNEVRLARQVSHPNVCRVYDIGETDGRHFISMEFVDGEDLASLLRRIGRLPKDKVVDIARQLCAGLAAAHDKGVLHRDLKPANVMIDNQGKARITDFGLAGLVVDLADGGGREGTPYYMAPEQLAGQGVTIRSEIYSLGLVLYEMLTGRPPYDAGSIAEMSRIRDESTPVEPSSIVQDLDPALERIILKCLERDPELRPASALLVAAALPGADPLAAALAAGETPSPEMVAAAGAVGEIRPSVGWFWLGLVFIGLIAIAVAGPRRFLSGFVPLDHRPQVLQVKAQEILQRLGIDDAPADTAMGFTTDVEAFLAIRRDVKTLEGWNRLEAGRPAVLQFWYRQSPRPLEAANFFAEFLGSVIVDFDDPPQILSGMTGVHLDTKGRLIDLISVPAQVEKDPAPAVTPDWTRLFVEAGLDPARFRPAEPEWLPPLHSDARGAWVRSEPAQPGLPDRVEAASWRGKPVYFQMVWPWTRPARMQPFRLTAGQLASQIILVTVFVAVLIGGLLVARHNVSTGKGDRRGANRLALFVMLVLMLHWAASASHVLTLHELALFIMGASGALFGAILVWLLYLALEPYVRRRWPGILISWSRLLSGRVRDPLVGRDLLAGTLLGVGLALFAVTTRFVVELLGWQVVALSGIPPSALMGVKYVASDLLLQMPLYLFFSLAALFLLLLLRLLVRKNWLASVIFVLIFATNGAAGSLTPAYGFVVTGAIWTFLVIILTRLGLLAATTCFIVLAINQSFLLTLNPAEWWAPTTWFAMIVTLALAVVAFRVASAGRSLLRGALQEE